ncbi:methyltransferase domain-containing protein [Spirillospora sp. CA-294931]|uniref:methyltransferase domain-containing protein n=1 Tax=Spirillospora sp. CA-294931 TaxID=3240042 RepID=UPI003D8E3535
MSIDQLVAMLDAFDRLPAAATLRERSYDLLRLAPGDQAADVGCGAGLAVAELAGRDVRAVGLDADPAMIKLAGERVPEGDFRVADARDLPFETASLAGYRVDKVLHALDDPETAIAEAHRVLRPGGRIVVLGQDWDTMVIDSDRPELTRTIVHTRADAVPSPRVARRHRNLLLDAGFEEVTVEVHTGTFTTGALLPLLSDMAESTCSTGAVSAADADAWAAEQRERAQSDRVFIAVPIFLAAATRG